MGRISFGISLTAHCLLIAKAGFTMTTSLKQKRTCRRVRIPSRVVGGFGTIVVHVTKRTGCLCMCVTPTCWFSNFMHASLLRFNSVQQNATSCADIACVGDKALHATTTDNVCVCVCVHSMQSLHYLCRRQRMLLCCTATDALFLAFQREPSLVQHETCRYVLTVQSLLVACLHACD